MTGWGVTSEAARTDVEPWDARTVSRGGSVRTHDNSIEGCGTADVTPEPAIDVGRQRTALTNLTPHSFDNPNLCLCCPTRRDPGSDFCTPCRNRLKGHPHG